MQQAVEITGLVQEMVRDALGKISSTQSTKNCLVLLPSYPFDISVINQYISKNIDPSKLVILHDKSFDYSQFSGNFKKVDVNDSVQMPLIVSHLNDFDEIICFDPPLNLLTKALAGDDRELYSFVLVQAALRGTSTIISLGFDQKCTKKGAFFDKVHELFDGMIDMGFRLDFRNAPIAAEIISQSDNRLITEEEVIALYRSRIKVIKINKQTILTPLARDKIRELEIVIEQV